MQKGQAQVLILAGIVILIAVAGGIFFLGRITAPKPQTPVVTSSPQPSPTPQSTPTSDETVNWKKYINTGYKFSMRYPARLIPKEQTSDTFLLNVFFKNPKETLYPLRDDFSVEIRNQSKLEEEISYRRWQLSHSIVNDIKETKITKDGFEGARLDYNFTSADQVYLKTIVIISGGYMYTIGGETSLTDQILSTFKFLP